MCFAYRGSMPKSGLRLAAHDSSSTRHVIFVPLNLTYNESHWNYTCIDIYPELHKNKIYSVVGVGFRSTNSDFWIDEFTITDNITEGK